MNALLSDITLLTESLHLAESITHRWLKTESEKPTPPAPADLQPVVYSLWRYSVIRRNLSLPAPNPPPQPKPAHVPHTADTEPAVPAPPSEAEILRSLEAVPVTRLIEFTSRRVAQHTKTEIAAIKAQRESAAAESASAAAASAASQPAVATATSSNAAPATASSPSAVPAIANAVPHTTPHTLAEPIQQIPAPLATQYDKSPVSPASHGSHGSYGSHSSHTSHSSPTSPPADSSLPPKFRYPPPKRTRV